MVWLPRGGAGAEGVRGGEEWEMAKESILRIDVPSHPFGELSRGRASCLRILSFVPGYLLAISLICALQR